MVSVERVAGTRRVRDTEMVLRDDWCHAVLLEPWVLSTDVAAAERLRQGASSLSLTGQHRRCQRFTLYSYKEQYNITQ